MKFPAHKTVKVADLVPYARNSRTHSDAQVAQIAASIREFGFTNPVLVDGANGVIAGHGRILAARKLGMETVPVIELAHLSEAQKRAYVIADNKLALNAGWDDEMLRAEFEELGDAGFDLALTGFGEDEIAAIINPEDDALSDEYSHKVTAPVYEPKGEKPPIAELVNYERAEALIRDIEAAKLPLEVAQFLKTAAARHMVFDYGKIAEFYCHADKPTQTLMEDSALVIIDFKKAMQLGYVKLKEAIADALENESSEGDDDDE